MFCALYWEIEKTEDFREKWVSMCFRGLAHMGSMIELETTDECLRYLGDIIEDVCYWKSLCCVETHMSFCLYLLLWGFGFLSCIVWGLDISRFSFFRLFVFNIDSVCTVTCVFCHWIFSYYCNEFVDDF